METAIIFISIYKIKNASMKIYWALFIVHHRCQKFHNDLRVAVISASTSSVARLNILNSIDTPGCRAKSIHISFSSVVEVVVAEAATFVASASTAAIQIEVQNNCVPELSPAWRGKSLLYLIWPIVGNQMAIPYMYNIT